MNRNREPLSIFSVRLRGAPGQTGIHALRAALKVLLRRYDLRAIDVREESSNQIADAFAGLRRDVRRRVKLNSRLRTADGAGSVMDAIAPRKEIPMDLSKYGPSRFLKVEDLKELGSFKAKIVAVEIGEKFDKPEIVLDDGSVLSLNATNCGRLLRVYGAESDDWLNKIVELAVGTVDYKGTPTETILLTPISPPLENKAPIKPVKPSAKSRKAERTDLDDEVAF
jgi:hypothetical protein